MPNYTPQNPPDNSAHNQVCTTDYISVADSKKIYFDNSSYKLLVNYYNAQKTYQTYFGYITTSDSYMLDTQYAYCVLELKKSDDSAFTDAEVIAVTGTVYYEKAIDTDIIRHAELQNVVDDINEEISQITVKRELQPSILPTLPISVYKIGSGYECDLPYSDLSEFAKVYVDSVNGDDTATGTASQPVKTLNRAIYLAQKQMYDNGKKVIIEIADNSVFYYDDYPISQSFTKSCIIRAENNAIVFAGKKPIFTVSGDYYVSEALTSYTIIGCVDTSETDDYGIFKTMTAVSSVDDVGVNENSYYIDSANKIVYVNPASSINDIVVIFSDNYALKAGAYSFTESSFLMYENIHFVGNCTATARASSTVGETIIRTVYMKKCIFEHSFTNNCVSFNDFENTYLINCVAGYAKLDCFNYHYQKKPTPTNALVVEVNCIAKEAGYYNANDGSDNLSTCHDEANILRCGCHGYNGNGSMCVDADGCYSVCVDCTYVNTSYNRPSGANRSAFEFYNSAGQRNGKAMMQNCFGYDTRNNKLVKAVDLILSGVNAGGSIDATNITVAKEVL